MYVYEVVNVFLEFVGTQNHRGPSGPWLRGGYDTIHSSVYLITIRHRRDVKKVVQKGNLFVISFILFETEIKEYLMNIKL